MTTLLKEIEANSTKVLLANRKFLPKRIIFIYYNSFTDEYLGGVDMNYDRQKSVNGFYTRWWKKWRPFLANENKIDKHWVRAKIYVC